MGPTEGGAGWVVFCLKGLEKPLLERTWKLPDVEAVKRNPARTWIALACDLSPFRLACHHSVTCSSSSTLPSGSRA